MPDAIEIQNMEVNKVIFNCAKAQLEGLTTTLGQARIITMTSMQRQHFDSLIESLKEAEAFNQWMRGSLTFKESEG